MKSNRICHLKLTLVQRDGSAIDDAAGMRLAGARQSISRELLVRGSMSLYELHTAIQNAFGWRNMHLHKFFLSDRDFGRVTGGSMETYNRLCGSLFRAGGKDSFGWHWHKLFGAIALDRSRVGDWTADESLFVNLMKTGLGRNDRLYQYVPEKTAAMEIWSTDSDKCAGGMHLSEQNAIAGAADIYRINVLLERLSVEELLTANKKHRHRDGSSSAGRLDVWRESVFRAAEKKRAEIIKYMEADAGRALVSVLALCRLEQEKQSYVRLMNMKNDGAGAGLCGTDAGALAEEDCRNRIIELHDEAHSLINDYNPRLEPFFDSINYRYDEGDGWYVNIACMNIYEKANIHGAGVSEDRKPYGKDHACGKAYCYEGAAADRSPEWSDIDGHDVKNSVCCELEAAADSGEPMCIAADGMDLFDDIGGVDGYFSFLRMLYGRDKSDAMRMTELAEAYGWRGPDRFFR